MYPKVRNRIASQIVNPSPAYQVHGRAQKATSPSVAYRDAVSILIDCRKKISGSARHDTDVSRRRTCVANIKRVGP